MEEMRSASIGWERATRLAQDRVIWRDLVEALCATGHYGIELELELKCHCENEQESNFCDIKVF